MKITLRVPTQDQYAFVEAEIDAPDGYLAQDAVEQYNLLKHAFTGGTGLEPKDFNRVIDEYLWGSGNMKADEYGEMNLDQQSIIQTIKRSRARNTK